MASRGQYLMRRAAAIPRALATPVGLVAAGGALVGIVALVVGGTAGRWLGALVVWYLFLLGFSANVSAR